MDDLRGVHNNHSGIRRGVIVNMLALLAIIAIGIIPLFNKNITNAYRILFFILWFFSLGTIGSLSFNNLEIGIIKWWFLYFFIQVLYSILF